MDAMSADEPIAGKKPTPEHASASALEEAGAGKTEWDRVKREHAAIVTTLNETPASFTARSAEGLAMYKGLESHSGNGRINELAKQGYLTMAERARADRAEKHSQAPELGDS
jgi:hypothetical protein